MSVIPHPPLSDTTAARNLLADLCRPFARDVVAPQSVIVQPEDIPFPEDHLLVHHDHMTVVLERHHRSRVQVHVMEEHQDGDQYTRKISLTPAGSDKVVEYGIVRLNFRYMSDAVREEILARRMPLGAILIKHNVHRRVKPRYFLRLPEHSPVMALFEETDNLEPVYGRLGTIYCDDEPAIELLETVLNTDVEGR
jgi:hypothetical protein